MKKTLLFPEQPFNVELSDSRNSKSESESESESKKILFLVGAL